jgi:hypothetical protein
MTIIPGLFAIGIARRFRKEGALYHQAQPEPEVMSVQRQTVLRIMQTAERPDIVVRKVLVIQIRLSEPARVTLTLPTEPTGIPGVTAPVLQEPIRQDDLQALQVLQVPEAVEHLLVVLLERQAPVQVQPEVPVQDEGDNKIVFT